MRLSPETYNLPKVQLPATERQCGEVIVRFG